MNRRSFLATLAAGLTLDPERLLWRPGVKLISIPKPALRLARHFTYYQSISIIQWKAMINDDLAAMGDYPALFGRAARRTEEGLTAKIFDPAGTDLARLAVYERTR